MTIADEVRDELIGTIHHPTIMMWAWAAMAAPIHRAHSHTGVRVSRSE